ncbi:MULTISPECIES: hypothetical protein [Nocardia]|uniref:hypothetical protein n=1 Tax=Nocardia TaxID=1817 RepID=UPI000BF04E2F|nr:MULTISPECIES: hypothetical protein [Nocardia]MBF6188871.1 hypothetical protein [Nocardia farcinica]MBF6294595.1 hypothetical protein [Nocardia farcinica]MBF6314045.1 hypothetical protein [Nocardia farcinica]MBF6381767.1 hypothetical protein [Nocardia farcinica]MBF6388092.1 hypothetical protein [Nocardia farcinica]
MVSTLLAYKQLPADVTEPLRQLFTWLLWLVEAALICKLAVVGGRAGWEYFHPPPGPPPGPAEVVRVLLSWILASAAWPVAGSLLIDLAL